MFAPSQNILLLDQTFLATSGDVTYLGSASGDSASEDRWRYEASNTAFAYSCLPMRHMIRTLEHGHRPEEPLDEDLERIAADDFFRQRGDAGFSSRNDDRFR